MLPLRYPLCEEDFTYGVLRETARRINFVWLLAHVHRWPEARRFLAVFLRAIRFRKLEDSSKRASVVQG